MKSLNFHQERLFEIIMQIKEFMVAFLVCKEQCWILSEIDHEVILSVLDKDEVLKVRN